MLSSTRNIYRQTFADPGIILLRKSLALDFESSEKAVDSEKDLTEMLLIKPRKARSPRSGASSDINDHATSHPASWQGTAKKGHPDAQTSINAGPSENVSATQPSSSAFSKTAIAALSLEQLQELSVLVGERIQIKKRFNSTPLRRIIARQTPSSAALTTPDVDEDAQSQTDTLVNTETSVTTRESPEVRRARYNTTPLRRILTRQTSGTYAEGHPSHVPNARFEPEPLEVRRARYNNTPLRRIVARQASAQTVPLKEDDNVSDRADSVIDPDSPVRAKSAGLPTRVDLNDEERIRAYEINVWNLSPSPETPTSASPSVSDSATAAIALNDEESAVGEDIDPFQFEGGEGQEEHDNHGHGSGRRFEEAHAYCRRLKG